MHIYSQNVQELHSKTQVHKAKSQQHLQQRTECAQRAMASHHETHLLKQQLKQCTHQLHAKEDQVHILMHKLQESNNELEARKRQLRQLNHQLQTSEQATSKLQQKHVVRKKQETRDMVPTKHIEFGQLKCDYGQPNVSVTKAASKSIIKLYNRRCPNAPSTMWKGSASVGDSIYMAFFRKKGLVL